MYTSQEGWLTSLEYRIDKFHNFVLHFEIARREKLREEEIDRSLESNTEMI